MKASNFSLFITLLLLMAYLNHSTAQAVKDYHSQAYWVDMMNDPDVNYKEACKAYDEFWKGRQKPKEEEDIIGQKQGENSGTDKDHHLVNEKLSNQQQSGDDLQKYAFLCKKFENWRRLNLPYVKPDGHLMSQQERQDVWKQQRNK